MAKLSYSEIFQAERRAKIDSLRQLAHELGILVSDEQLERAADIRMHAAMREVIAKHEQGKK